MATFPQKLQGQAKGHPNGDLRALAKFGLWDLRQLEKALAREEDHHLPPQTNNLFITALDLGTDQTQLVMETLVVM